MTLIGKAKKTLPLINADDTDGNRMIAVIADIARDRKNKQTTTETQRHGEKQTLPRMTRVNVDQRADFEIQILNLKFEKPRKHFTSPSTDS